MVFLVAALLPFATHTAVAQPASVSQRAFAPARQALDAAIAAHGGLDALRAIKLFAALVADTILEARSTALEGRDQETVSFGGEPAEAEADAHAPGALAPR